LATFKINKNKKALDHVKDRKISNHFKLFSRFIAHKTYFLIAHRNFVSVLDLTDVNCDNLECEHFMFDDNVRGMTILDVDKPLDSNAKVPN
jgi:hypothetical protein